jgi:hypothetical protein
MVTLACQRLGSASVSFSTWQGMAIAGLANMHKAKPMALTE